MKHRVFERMEVFSTEYGPESGMFLENVFLQNMDMRAVIFSWKIEKKLHPIDFVGQ